MKEFEKPFKDGELERICRILGDTNDGLTGTEIAHHLEASKIIDIDPMNTKWKRLFNAFANHQYKSKTGKCVLNFIVRTLEPSRFFSKKENYINILREINKVLAFRGIKFCDDGRFHTVEKASSLSEIEAKVMRFREKLIERNVHEYILTYCNSELLHDNYFHAVLEACKSIASKIREITGLDSDGARLIDDVFGGKDPVLKINSFDSESKKSEQSGFVNLAKGLFGTFRNPTAHNPKIEWEMTEDDALDIFVLASYILRRILKIKK